MKVSQSCKIKQVEKCNWRGFVFALGISGSSHSMVDGVICSRESVERCFTYIVGLSELMGLVVGLVLPLLTNSESVPC